MDGATCAFDITLWHFIRAATAGSETRISTRLLLLDQETGGERFIQHESLQVVGAAGSKKVTNLTLIDRRASTVIRFCAEETTQYTWFLYVVFCFF